MMSVSSVQYPVSSFEFPESGSECPKTQNPKHKMIFLLIFAILVTMIIFAGCLEKTKKLGCCAKVNASKDEGCYFYNISSNDTNNMYVNLYSVTNGCNLTTGYCNVTIYGKPAQIPICSDDNLTACVKPNCTAMACGDFTYKPRIAPGVVSEEDYSDATPTENATESLQGLYGAQCRFLSVDSKLAATMKTSSASLNSFRLGIGKDFDEYDLYKNYFPMSDKFCGINSQGTVDRYMNYIDSSYKAFDPSQISENCINDSKILGPFTFGNSSDLVLPEKSSYKFALSYRYDLNSSESFDFYKVFHPNAIFKKLDKKFYRKVLSSEYADDFYSASAVRAPFECNSQSSECLSGYCNTEYYSRGVALIADSSGTETEVPVDCDVITDTSGSKGVVCYPTISVDKSTTKGGEPTVTYARVSYKPFVFEVYQDNYGRGDIMEIAADDPYCGCSDYNEDWEDDCRCELNVEWRDFFDNEQNYLKILYEGSYTQIRTMPDAWGINITTNEEDETTKTTYIGSQTGFPPAAQIWFPGMNFTYNNKQYIGIAVIDEDDFKNTYFAKYCGITSTDYEKVDLSDKTVWEDLMKSFYPYFEARMDYIGGADWGKDGCGERTDDGDLVISSIPWIPAYRKYGGEALQVTGTGSPAIYEYLNRNIYDKSTKIIGMDKCTIRQYVDEHDDNEGGYDSEDLHGDEDAFVYEALWPKTIFLLKATNDSSGNEKIGKCKLASKYKMPDLRTYGWCEPCTLTTLAYQKVTTREPYLPVYDYDLSVSKLSSICKSGGTCYAPWITDIGDYSSIDISSVGAPRTEPEASLMKERLGNYLKSGIMPVIDLSDESNWNRSNSDGSTNYSEYDFKRLLSNAGAIVVVVDQVGSSDSMLEKQSLILNRTNLIRNYCWRCLTAVQIIHSDNEDFNDTIKDLFADPYVKYNVDLVTIGYNTASVGNIYNTTMTDDEKAEAVVMDMSTLGQISLQKDKPLIITKFFASKDEHWDESNYGILFSKIIEQQDKLVNGGVIGIIYSPVRDVGADYGLVDNSTGTKSAKFCALEQASTLLGTTRSYAQFMKTSAYASMNCTKCNSLDTVLGKCNTTCENGVKCTLPYGASSSQYKCPDGGVVSPCTLCNQMSGYIYCNKTFVNGTKTCYKIDPGAVDSDIFGDVIGGLKKPEKCCINDSYGNNYTYTKKLLSNVVSTPIIYPKGGNKSLDCGFSSSGMFSISGAFCGIKLPISNYDMECKLVSASDASKIPSDCIYIESNQNYAISAAITETSVGEWATKALKITK